MYFKRNESYRFVFSEPINGKLTKTELGNTVTVNVQVLDVSNHGAKIYCPDSVSLQEHGKIALAFHLNTSYFHSSGTIVWVKKFRQSFEAGLHLHTSDEYREKMTSELKRIAKQERHAK
ncbi:PilZ domain-containing protein [Lentibacillus lipolyticus]|nr:PilZ domain-containing protein [Lentibacillus lipolyticus]